MTSDPWASAFAAPPKITAHQVARIVELIADYTTAEATDLIVTLASRRTTGPCGACGYIAGVHSSTCPTQGDRS